MTESFEGNGDYSYNNDEEENFKRKSNDVDNVASNDNPQDSSHLNEKATEYIRDCISEKSRMDKKYPIAERLLETEIEKTQSTGRIPTREPKYVDIYREKPIRVAQKVLVPVREHPKFNFVGKLLGPKGNSLRRLQEETLCKMTVLGRHSMKDRAKEEELRNSGDPKYSHLNDDLHVEISTIAPPAEAHARIAYAMAELRKYLIPDSNDIIRQEQLRELMDDPNAAALLEAQEAKNLANNTNYKPRNQASGQRQSYGGYSARTSNSRPPAHAPTQHPPPSGNRIAMPPKQKVLSILDRARSAMEDNYSSRHPYEEPMAYEQPAYDSYSYSHAPPTSSRAPYEVPEYESEYRRDYYQHSPSYQVNQGGGNSNSGGSGTAQGIAAGNVNTNHNRAHVNRWNLLPAGHSNNSGNGNGGMGIGGVGGNCIGSGTNNGIVGINKTTSSVVSSSTISSTSTTSDTSNNPKVQAAANNNRIQGPATATNLLFVRPANPSLHVGKLPFLPVQFL